ncbi:hypothetical protein [Arthrobacter bambusae]|uniref:AcrR family transcriptional regulator n=1 Tax=Arthrobacter bambusae TaxID=1338426 RepID=A0AAW8D9T4_9MICC|nr:hypothetical protein [Arthrobacter bambusae]MDP9903238.1 AcrR family transcriptional regulator [Arthrobacter bambusae]MDQ0128768.1 AcrR family transcriptional regulator [Arthrobacter bambusae]MDQ0180109.1 AcrR family transcriptional regulator [Arthrobacter bambusae]
MNPDELIDKIMTAHEEALRLQSEQLEAVQRRRELIRDAAQRDVSMQAIADALGVDRQRVYQMAK